jgi:hypothetical protein
MLRNNFLYWHMELEKKTKSRIPTKDIAIGAGIEPTNYTRCEKNRHLPDSINLLYKLWLFYKKHFPSINIQDLIDYSDEE